MVCGDGIGLSVRCEGLTVCGEGLYLSVLCVEGFDLPVCGEVLDLCVYVRV